MPLEVILFDLDETLVVEHVSVEMAFNIACRKANERYGCNPIDLSNTVRSKASKLWHKAPTYDYCFRVGISSWEGLCSSFLGDDLSLSVLRRWAPDYRCQSWAQALLEFGVEDLRFAQELSEIFVKERRGRHFLFPEVVDSLLRLRTQYRLGIITNGSSDLQREKIERTGIGHFFEAIFISSEIGIGKPDGRLFKLALDKFSVNSGSAIFIGDSLERDITGAHNVGIKGVWMNRSGLINNQKTVPDCEISNLSELQKYCSIYD